PAPVAGPRRLTRAVPRPAAHRAGGLPSIPLRERRSNLVSPFSERPTPLGFPARGGHLGRLHGNLVDLDERLPDAVAQAIRQAAAGVVRQIALPLLGQAEDGPTLLRLPSRPAGRGRPLWQALDDPEDRDRPPWLDEPEDDAPLYDRDADDGRVGDVLHPS